MSFDVTENHARSRVSVVCTARVAHEAEHVGEGDDVERFGVASLAHVHAMHAVFDDETQNLSEWVVGRGDDEKRSRPSETALVHLGEEGILGAGGARAREPGVRRPVE